MKHAMRHGCGPAASSYLAVVTGRVEADLGGPLGAGTTIVAAEDRKHSHAAVVYDLIDRTAIWCDPAVAARLQPLAGPEPLTIADAVRRCTQLGGEPGGVGENRVLEPDTALPEADLGDLRPLWLDPREPADVELLAGLRNALSDDDADEAEFDLDDLDAVILGLAVHTAGLSMLIAQAGARPWMDCAALGDIGVAVHPHYRRRGLGAAVVAMFAAAQADTGLQMVYRYDIANAGSKALADAVGFTLVHAVAAVRFPGAASDTA